VIAIGAPVVGLAVELLQLEQLLADQPVDPRLVAENRPQLGDALLEVPVLLVDPLALELRQPLEAEVEDRLRLDLAELELLHQAGAGGVGVGRPADQRDHRVEVVERDQVAPQDVRPLLRLAELELRPAGDDLALEVEVFADQLEQRERLRDAVGERDCVVAEGRLELGVLEQLVQRDLRDGIALQLDIDAHALLVRVVLQGIVGHRHLVQRSRLDEVRDLLDHAALARLTDAVRQLGDDDRALAAA
jgi:hypothetical protein